MVVTYLSSYAIPIATTIILIGIIIYQAKRNSKLRIQRDNFADALHKSEKLVKAVDIANQKYKKFYAENHTPNELLDVTGMLNDHHKTDP